MRGGDLGYVPREFAIDLAPLLDAGTPFDARCTKILTGGRVPIPVVEIGIEGTQAAVAARRISEERAKLERLVASDQRDRMKQSGGKRTGCAGTATAFLILAGVVGA